MRTSSTIKTYRQTLGEFASCLALTGWVMAFTVFACALSPQFAGRLEWYVVTGLELLPI